jgi:hypothetical protein
MLITTKTFRHDIAEILLKVALNTKNQIKPNHYMYIIINITFTLHLHYIYVTFTLSFTLHLHYIYITENHRPWACNW